MSLDSQSRRNFIKLVGAAGGGLVVGIPLVSCASSVDVAHAGGGDDLATAFIRITPANNIEFYLPRAEMGQGVIQGLTTLIAEELSTSPSLISVEFVPVNTAYKNPEFGIQATGGSTSMKAHYLPLRQAAADVAQALLQAASSDLGVQGSELYLDNGQVVASGIRHPFGDFVERAQSRPLPKDSPLKPAGELLFIGKSSGPRVDARIKSTGQAEYGMDTEFPGLMRAALQRCPVAGGSVASFKADKASMQPGVEKIVRINHGVAVIAQTYWQAKRALAMVEVEWELPELTKFSSSGFRDQLAQAMDNDDGKEAHREGRGVDALAASDRVHTATYWAPYLAHAAMEPLNCAVKIDGDRCDVWTGTQTPQMTRGLVASFLDVDVENVAIHNTFLGGGFGRRLSADYVLEACMLAREAGLPLQLVWSREDDMRHDIYRPASLARFSASFDDRGKVNAYSVKRAGPNIMPYATEENLAGLAPGFIPDRLVDWAGDKAHDIFADWVVDYSSVEGLFEDYDFPHKEVRHVTVDPGLPCGFWRSVGHSFSGFFKEGFVDELAVAGSQDPVAFRLQHCEHDARFANVLRLAAEKGSWGKPVVASASQGVAAHTSFGSRVAQVVEVTVEGGQIRVHRVCCVVDCGLAVTPDVVRAQMEGGIIFGLSAALYGGIDIEEGAVVQSNFHDYQVLRMAETPVIDVHIVDSAEAPSGVGEPGVPPIAAAVANAVFAATGQRLRSLPLTPV